MFKNTRTLVALAALAVPLLAEDPAQIESALLAKYKLSTLAPNHQSVVNTGVVLVLSKGNLLMAHLTMGNTYKNGRITQSKILMMAQTQESFAAGSRTFQQGERVLVTGIEVKPKGVNFELYAIADNAAYRGKIDFPLDKKSEPSLAEVMQQVAEVFQIQPDGGPQYVTQVQAPQDPNQAPPPAPVEPPAAPLPQIPSLGQSVLPQDLAQPPAPARDPSRIKIGQTMAQVKSAWGPPVKTRTVAGKQVWVYPPVELVFVSSKLSDIR